MWLWLSCFAIGFLEDLLGTGQMKAIAEGKLLWVLLTNFVHTLLYLVFISLWVEQIDNFQLALAYALGSALGAFVLVWFVRRHTICKSLKPRGRVHPFRKL